MLPANRARISGRFLPTAYPPVLQQVSRFPYAPPNFTGTIAEGLQGFAGMGDDGDSSTATAEQTVADIQNITDSASGFVTSVNNFLGVRAGANEANVIVPYQNQLVKTVIAPISAAVSGPLAPSYTRAQLQTIMAKLSAAQTSWLNFLHGTSWTDGRAARQAEATLFPYFDGLATRLNQLMATAGSGGIVSSIWDALMPSPGVNVLPPIGSVAYPGAPTAGPLQAGGFGMLAAGVVAFLFFRRKK